MKFELSKYYGLCTTRGRARKVRGLILNQLLPSETILTIDLSGVDIVSMSFLDELIVCSIKHKFFTNLQIEIIAFSPSTERYLKEAAKIRKVGIDNVRIVKAPANAACKLLSVPSP